MACIDDIVTIGLCDTTASTSGYTLMTAPGMSPKNAANITTEQYQNSLELLETIKQNALRCVRTDFNGFLQANQVATTITNRVYDSAKFVVTKNNGLYAGRRGQTLFANVAYQRGNMRQLRIISVETYALASGAGDIVISDFDNGVPTETTYPTTFVANTKQIHVLPTPYTATSSQVSVLIDNTTINFASSEVLCGMGCSGQPKNTCATVDGYDGTDFVRKEGYGLNVQFSCDCDYDKLICDLTKAFTGELIWYKMQELFYETQLKSNKFNGWVLYNTEQVQNNIIPDLQAKYSNKFNSMVSGGIFNILKQYNDDCLNCRGVRWQTNI
jgi:hypothetical protein